MGIFWIILIYWVVASIWGNKFIQFSVAGISTYYVLMAISILYLICIYLRCGNSRTSYNMDRNRETLKGMAIFRISNESRRWVKSVKIFATIALLYLGLSYFDIFTQIFNLQLDFDIRYVLRQGYFILCFPIAFVIIYHLPTNKNLLKVLSNRKKLIVVWVFLLILKEFFFFDSIVYRTSIFAIASSILVLDKKSISSWIVMVYTFLRLISIDLYSSSVIAVAVAIVALVFVSFLTDVMKKNLKIKLLFFSIFAAILFYVFYNRFLSYLGTDPSTEWRWQYWVHEFKILIETKFAGVGFGTAYGKVSIFNEINNPTVFTSSTKGAEAGTGLFIVAQHNSYINMLYRLGIIGFLAFVNVSIVSPMRWFCKTYKCATAKAKQFMQWNIMNYFFNQVIIITNPGLESPRFAIGFLITYGFLIGGLLLIDKELYEKKWIV